MTDDIIKPPPKPDPSTWAGIVGNEPGPPWPGNRHERRARAARLRRGLYVEHLAANPDATNTLPTTEDAKIISTSASRCLGNERTDAP